MEKDVEKKRELAAAEKAKGNKFFSQRNYRQAIEHYSKVKLNLSMWSYSNPEQYILWDANAKNSWQLSLRRHRSQKAAGTFVAKERGVDKKGLPKDR